MENLLECKFEFSNNTSYANRLHPPILGDWKHNQIAKK